MSGKFHRKGRRAVWWPAALVLLCALLTPVPRLRVLPGEEERPVYARFAWSGFRFTLAFTHSIYDVPVEEHFRVDWRGRLLLTEIRSTDPRIVGYYDIEGAQADLSPGHVRIFGMERVHGRLPVKGTGIGRRTYDDGRCRFSLASVAGDRDTVIFEVKWQALLHAAMNRGERGCPSDRKTP